MTESPDQWPDSEGRCFEESGLQVTPLLLDPEAPTAAAAAVMEDAPFEWSAAAMEEAAAAAPEAKRLRTTEAAAPNVIPSADLAGEGTMRSRYAPDKKSTSRAASPPPAAMAAAAAATAAATAAAAAAVAVAACPVSLARASSTRRPPTLPT